MKQHIAGGQIPADVQWVKSSFSAAGNCVELAVLGPDEIGIRNSKAPNGPALVFDREDMRAFIRGVDAGEFDSLVRVR